MLFVIYFYLDNVIGMISGLTVFIMFLIQQAFVWLKTWIKIWFLGSELSLYKLFPVIEAKQEEKEIVPEITNVNEGQGLFENPLPS